MIKLVTLKNVVVTVFLMLSCTISSQTLTKTYSTNNYSPTTQSYYYNHKKIVLNDKIYYAYRDSGAIMVLKTNLLGDIKWIKRHVNFAPDTFDLHNNGADLVLIGNYSNLTNWCRIDTANGTLITGNIQFMYLTTPSHFSTVLNSGHLLIVGKSGSTYVLNKFKANFSGTLQKIDLTATLAPNLSISTIKIEKIGPNSAIVYGLTTNGLNYIFKVDSGNTTTIHAHVLKRASVGSTNQLLNGTIKDDFSNSHYFMVGDLSVGGRMIMKSDTVFGAAVKNYTIRKITSGFLYISGIFAANSMHSSGNRLYIPSATANAFPAHFNNPMVHVFDTSLNYINTSIFPVASYTNPFSSSPRAIIDFKYKNNTGYLSYRSMNGSSSPFFPNYSRLWLHVTDNNVMQTCATSTMLNTFSLNFTSDSMVITKVAQAGSIGNTIPFITQANTTITNSVTCSSVGVFETFEFNQGILIQKFSDAGYEISSENGTLESIDVYDLSGRIVYREKNIKQSVIRVDLIGYSNGLYFIKACTSNSERVFKVLKN